MIINTFDQYNENWKKQDNCENCKYKATSSFHGVDMVFCSMTGQYKYYNHICEQFIRRS